MSRVILNLLFLTLGITALGQEKARIVPVEQTQEESSDQGKTLKKDSESFQLDYSGTNGDNGFRVVDLRKHSSQYVQMAGMIVDTFFDQQAYHVKSLDSFSVSSAIFNFGYRHRGRQDTLFITFRNASASDYSVLSGVLEEHVLLIDSTTFSGPNEYQTIRRASIEFPSDLVFRNGAVAMTFEFSGTDGSQFGAAFGFENEGSCPGENRGSGRSSDGSIFYPRSFYQFGGAMIPYEQSPRYRDCNGNEEYDAGANEEPLLQNLAVVLNGTLYPTHNPSGQSQEMAEARQFKLFPNPAQNRLTWPQDVHVQELEIMNLQGQKVAAYHQPEGAVRLEMPEGTYMAEVRTQDQQVYHVKFVKN